MSVNDAPRAGAMTPEDHAVAITEAIDSLLWDHGSSRAAGAGARAALADAITAALESVRAPTWVPADNAAHQAAHVDERAAIVSMLRAWGAHGSPQVRPAYHAAADAIERGEHLHAGECVCSVPSGEHAHGCPARPFMPSLLLQRCDRCGRVVDGHALHAPTCPRYRPP